MKIDIKFKAMTIDLCLSKKLITEVAKEIGLRNSLKQ
jgi:hypothetical protein